MMLQLLSTCSPSATGSQPPAAEAMWQLHSAGCRVIHWAESSPDQAAPLSAALMPRLKLAPLITDPLLCLSTEAARLPEPQMCVCCLACPPRRVMWCACRMPERATLDAGWPNAAMLSLASLSYRKTAAVINLVPKKSPPHLPPEPCPCRCLAATAVAHCEAALAIASDTEPGQLLQLPSSSALLVASLATAINKGPAALALEHKLHVLLGQARRGVMANGTTSATSAATGTAASAGVVTAAAAYAHAPDE